MTAASRSCIALALLFPKVAPAKSESRKKRNLFSFPLYFHHLPSFLIKSKRQSDIFDQKKGPFDQKRDQKMTLFGLFFINRPFFIKRHLFSIKNIHFFFIIVSVDHISFSGASTGPLHIKWHEIYARIPRQICFSTFRQTGTGPRPTHPGPQGKSELCEM